MGATSPPSTLVAPSPSDSDSDATFKKPERTISLDEGDEKGKHFSQCVHELDPASHHDRSPSSRARGAPCGIGCGMREDPGITRDFSSVLQDMIRRLQSAPKSLRMRIFDNRTIPFDVEGGQVAMLEASRCTQFQRLRAAAGVSEEEYYHSMCGQPFQNATIEKSGKSGSLFLRTHDNRFVLKTIELHEFDALQDILPDYVLYLEENTESLLCRFFAAYSLTMDGITLRLVVMENVLPKKALQVYDLKGTTEDRWVEPESKGVMKDNNFNACTMLFEPSLRKRLVQAVRDDAEFLESLGLMDYSLLVGISPDALGANGINGVVNGQQISRAGADLKLAHGRLGTGGDSPVPHVFQFGIIDYLQRWTPKKVAAHWLKKSTLGCFHEIDTEPPAVYCARFYKYLNGKIVSF
eukprot:TRINITY_DN17084_c0_g1_i1.p1 TRINITY_DN17084_c0_g1~~TRINITY_DN17084_c0_g1_i1.p1  ORF type:complete len:409 (+),score=55.79 TRINITY_DN17084_c0_g1_i1:58-1284(+)